MLHGKKNTEFQWKEITIIVVYFSPKFSLYFSEQRSQCTTARQGVRNPCLPRFIVIATGTMDKEEETLWILEETESQGFVQS